MLKVMIVDDMEVMRKELKKLDVWGEKTGFIIASEAKNGKDAIKELRNKKIDLVLTDIRMPVVDGVELLKKIIEEDLCPCIVFLSEYTEFEYARQGIIYGAFDYLVKPVDEEKLELLLNKAKLHINKRKKQDEKIKKLENELEEKVEIFYTTEDVEKLIKLYKEIDETVIEAAANLVDTMAAAVDYDLLKLVYIQKRIMLDLVEELKNSFHWIEKLANLGRYVDTNFAEAESYEESKRLFLSVIRELYTNIKKFELSCDLNSMVRNICKIVLEHTDNQLSIKMIADEMFLNQSYLSTLFREKTGIPLLEYITMVKMERAKILFGNSEIKNYEIANKLGYKDVEYFSKVFKKYTGITPSEFKNISITKN